MDKRLLNRIAGCSGRRAARCSVGTDCRLNLGVASGNTVTLERLFLGGWPDADRTIVWSVTDLFDNSVVASDPGASVSGATGLVVNVNKTSTLGFAIKFGPDGFDGGINDITDSSDTVNSVGGGTPVPAPAALALSGVALVGLGTALRRQG